MWKKLYLQFLAILSRNIGGLHLVFDEYEFYICLEVLVCECAVLNRVEAVLIWVISFRIQVFLL